MADSSITIRDSNNNAIRVRTDLGTDGIHTPQHIVRTAVLASGAATESTLSTIATNVATSSIVTAQTDRIIDRLNSIDGADGSVHESVTISSSTAAVNIVSQPAIGTKAVVTGIQVSNASDTNVTIYFRQGAANTIKKRYYLAANGGGIVWEGRWDVTRDDPISVLLSSSVNSVYVNSDYHLESV